MLPRMVLVFVFFEKGGHIHPESSLFRVEVRWVWWTLSRDLEVSRSLEKHSQSQ